MKHSVILSEGRTDKNQNVAESNESLSESERDSSPLSHMVQNDRSTEQLLETVLLRTLAFHATWGHAPTLAEWMTTLEISHKPEMSEIVSCVRELEQRDFVVEQQGRYTFKADQNQIDKQRQNELWMPRKLRRARQVARWLTRWSSVRFVALCNTTALGHADDESDLDFFIIVRAGQLMTTRALVTLPFKVLKQRPGEEARDPVCLSYFVTDDGLDLSSHMLQPDDPYFRYWFLSLLPLYDDGVGHMLWTANQHITSRHALAQPWMVSPDVKIAPRWQLPVPSVFESWATSLQTKRFPETLRSRMNQDTRIMVTPQVLKFHVEDGREKYREIYHERCRILGI